MAILDAMGCGLPIVSTDVGGIPKIVRQGINGYLYKPGDSKSMACAIIEYLTDDEKQKDKFYLGAFYNEQELEVEKRKFRGNRPAFNAWVARKPTQPAPNP